MLRSAGRIKRRMRIRGKISGNATRPRVSIYRSLKNIYVQVVDDDRGVTLACANSLDPTLKERRKEMDKKGIAVEVGKLLAERCKSAGVKRVVFDRGGCQYQGRVKALADGAREGGLDF